MRRPRPALGYSTAEKKVVNCRQLLIRNFLSSCRITKGYKIRNSTTISFFRFTLHGSVIFLTKTSVLEYRCHIIHKATALSCTEIMISIFVKQKSIVVFFFVGILLFHVSQMELTTKIVKYVSNRQQTTDNRQQTTDNRQQTTDNRQQTTDNRQQTHSTASGCDRTVTQFAVLISLNLHLAVKTKYHIHQC